jgi:outer membrane receptor for ferric coprogen and ferric-rhodotorulic acid
VQPNIAAGGAPLPPLTGNQYELGIKYRTVNQRLLLTAAIFQLDEKNLGQFFEQVGSFIYYKPADVRHRGVEFQALGQLSPQWQINTGYAYLDPKVIRGLDPNTLNPVFNSTEVFQPKQTASLYTTYSLQGGLLKGLTFGGGPRFVSHQRTAYDDSTKDLPGYVLADASASYSIAKWLVQLNAHNVFNKRYFINNYQSLIDGNLIGEPLNVSLSVRRDF